VLANTLFVAFGGSHTGIDDTVVLVLVKCTRMGFVPRTTALPIDHPSGKMFEIR
jgi:hypothetical protein